MSIDPKFLNQYIDDAVGFLTELHEKEVILFVIEESA